MNLLVLLRGAGTDAYKAAGHLPENHHHCHSGSGFIGILGLLSVFGSGVKLYRCVVAFLVLPQVRILNFNELVVGVFQGYSLMKAQILYW